MLNPSRETAKKKKAPSWDHGLGDCPAASLISRATSPSGQKWRDHLLRHGHNIVTYLIEEVELTSMGEEAFASTGRSDPYWSWYAGNDFLKEFPDDPAAHGVDEIMNIVIAGLDDSVFDEPMHVDRRHAGCVLHHLRRAPIPSFTKDVERQWKTMRLLMDHHLEVMSSEAPSLPPMDLDFAPILGKMPHTSMVRLVNAIEKRDEKESGYFFGQLIQLGLKRGIQQLDPSRPFREVYQKKHFRRLFRRIPSDQRDQLLATMASLIIERPSPILEDMAMRLAKVRR